MIAKKALVVGVISILALTAIPFIYTVSDDSYNGSSPLGLVRASQVIDREYSDMETSYLVSGFDGVILELTEVRTGEVVRLTDPAENCTNGAFCHITDGWFCNRLENITTGDFCNPTEADGCTEGVICNWLTWDVDC